MQAQRRSPVVVCAPDKMKGTLSSAQVARAMSQAAAGAGWVAQPCPLSDGGEGFDDVAARLGGESTTVTVSDPLGRPIRAALRMVGDRAFVESARASGLALVGGRQGNDAIQASSRGTGELMVAAVRLGARSMVVGVGGSATTDGGLGALQALEEAGGWGRCAVTVACDVDVPFMDAADLFGPQKGADPGQVQLLRRRLEDLSVRYLDRFGVDVGLLDRAGAAGGLAGALAAMGASLVAGFDFCADLADLDSLIGPADLVVTGEGLVDASSWSGKVVGGVVGRAGAADKPVAVVAGAVEDDSGAGPDVELVDLSARYGASEAMHHAYDCVVRATAEVLSRRQFP